MMFRRLSGRARIGSQFGLTTSGWFFFLLMALIIGAAVSSGHNLLYLTVCLFFGVFIVMGNVAVTNLRGLEVERKDPTYIFADTPCPVEVRVRNRRRIMDSFSLEIRELSTRAGKSLGKAFFPLVEKGKESHRSYPLLAPRRGWFDLYGLEIVTRFPFGFWERSRGVAMPKRLLVFPRVFETWPEEPANLAVDGEYIGKRLGTGDDLLNFRNFQPGDPVRWIHWKNSAKTDKLTVAVFHHPENRQVTVCLRTFYPDKRNKTLGDHFEEAVSWAATAVCKLIQAGVAVGYMDEAARIPPGLGEGQQVQILTRLALLEIAWERKSGLVFPTEPTASGNDSISIEATSTGVRMLTGAHKHLFEEAAHG
ncbi:MAG: hypothetical protein GHCLOJNM_00960 [bacterium]|nr:hypothetical protein [bacterium]